MSWLRLYLTVEGQAELLFARSILRPHLAECEVDLRPRMIPTNRKLGTRGGAVSFARFQRDTAALMKEDAGKEARFSTLIDLYALPDTFPGWAEARKLTKPAERAQTLEAALAGELGDPRFIPYLQLHEFEALLYCDLREIQARIPGSQPAIAALQQEVAGVDPEDIDAGEATAPSKRLIRHVPRYARLKVSVGVPAVSAIGLSVLRERCPHFGQWLARLEKLKESL